MLHKRLFLSACIAAFFSPLCLTAQTVRDTIALNEIVIVPARDELTRTGQRVEGLDSTRLNWYTTQSLATLLSEQSSVYIKSYGPGALASTAFRGGNASQTAILWNGINIQNYMLGQADLSLLPSILFDNVQVEYGSSSSLWGSGAASGSILLNNKTAFAKGPSLSLYTSAGSFGLVNGAAKIVFSQKKFASGTRLYSQSSENNYVFAKDGSRMSNAEYGQHGLLQEFRFRYNARNIFSLSTWLMKARNLIPLSASGSESSRQQTNSARMVFSYQRLGRKIMSQANIAALSEELIYQAAGVAINSTGRVQTLIAENDNSLKIKRHFVHAGLNATFSKAVSGNYEGVKTFSRFSFLAGDRFNLLKNKLVLQVNARLEYFSAVRIPFTWNVAADYEPFRKFVLKLNLAKVYRQPTFNELYWQPGGNAALRPEQGYSAEGSILYSFVRARWITDIAGSVFTRKIDDWILWVPGPASQPASMNVNQVWSRGTETECKVSYAQGKCRLSLFLRSSYVLSTVVKSVNNADASVNKQLIYTPRYTGSASLQIAFAGWQLVFSSQYAGYRFTASDNSQWIDPYLIHSVRLSSSFFKRKLNAFIACRNLFDTPYAVVAGHPMALRSFEGGINIFFQHQNHIKTK